MLKVKLCLCSLHNSFEKLDSFSVVELTEVTRMKFQLLYSWKNEEQSYEFFIRPGCYDNSGFEGDEEGFSVRGTATNMLRLISALEQSLKNKIL